MVSVWPPQWASVYSGGDKFATGEEGTLKTVRKVDNRLTLTMDWEKREHTGVLDWTPPPSSADVEAVLRRHIGDEIKAIGALEI